MTVFDASKLFGGKFKVEYPTTKPDEPVVFWVQHPGDDLKQFLLAESGMLDAPKDEGGNLLLSNSDGVRAYADYRSSLAVSCITGAENLEDWPDVCVAEGPSGWPTLTPLAFEAIPVAHRRAILLDIGNRVLEASGVDEEEGNESTSPHSGDTTEPSVEKTS